jgi:hypothetical protein
MLLTVVNERDSSSVTSLLRLNVTESESTHGSRTSLPDDAMRGSAAAVRGKMARVTISITAEAYDAIRASLDARRA